MARSAPKALVCAVCFVRCCNQMSFGARACPRGRGPRLPHRDTRVQLRARRPRWVHRRALHRRAIPGTPSRTRSDSSGGSLLHDAGVQVLHIEVEQHRTEAADLYRKSGYLDSGRRLMSKRFENADIAWSGRASSLSRRGWSILFTPRSRPPSLKAAPGGSFSPRPFRSTIAAARAKRCDPLRCHGAALRASLWDRSRS